MSRWWWYILGLDPARVPADAQARFVWTHAPHSWGVFVFLGVVALLAYLVFFLYRRELATCPRSVRLLLATLRLATVLILAGIYLGPALALTQNRIIEPEIFLLLDDSLSMSVRDYYVDPTAAQHTAAALRMDLAALRAAAPARAQVVEQAFNQGSFLRDIARRGRLQALTFAAQTAPLDLPPATQPVSASAAPAPGLGLPQLHPQGPATDIARAVREALRNAAGQPVAAVILVSDGQNTAGDDPAGAAALAQAQGVPILTVGVGDPARPRRLGVENVWARQIVWQGEPFSLEATLQAQNVPEQTVEVELLERPLDEPAAGAVRVAVQSVRLSSDQPRPSVVFEHRPQRAGRFVYTVRLAGAADQAAAARSINVTVVDQKVRVLLIAGAPTWDYQLVKNLLLRDKTINLSCWLQAQDLDVPQEGATVIAHFPDQPEELLQYDLVLMFDPNPSPDSNPLELSAAWVDQLKRFVGEHAGGWLFAAGPTYTGRLLTSAQTAGLRDLLPVRLGDLDTLDIDTLVSTFNRSWPLQVTAEGFDHAVARFAADPLANRKIWQSLPGVYWSFPARAAKPTARVLLEHSDPGLRTPDGPRPLLVAGQYGAGRTLYVGFDSTWRWRSVGRDSEYFDKFWIQAVRYLVEGRRLGGARRGVITIPGDVYAIGSTVAVTARLYDAGFAPLAEAVVPAALETEQGAAVPVELKAVPNRPGYYQAALVPSQVGTHTLAVTLHDPAGPPVRITRAFNVELPRIELADTRMNKGTLQELAQRSGGRYFEIDQLDQLPAAIPERRQIDVVRSKPIDLWDTSRVLLVLVALLGGEWAVRKRCKLL